jgi:hypothetical protein
MHAYARVYLLCLHAHLCYVLFVHALCARMHWVHTLHCTATCDQGGADAVADDGGVRPQCGPNPYLIMADESG